MFFDSKAKLDRDVEALAAPDHADPQNATAAQKLVSVVRKLYADMEAKVAQLEGSPIREVLVTNIFTSAGLIQPHRITYQTSTVTRSALGRLTDSSFDWDREDALSNGFSKTVEKLGERIERYYKKQLG